MTITNYWVAAPSAAPTVSNSTTGTIQLAHRRVNPDGTYSAPSPIKTNIVLPNTATPQTYATSDVYRDEFLASNDSGATWRIVPRTGVLTGAQAIPAFDNSWAIASLADTQESAATLVNFGTFLSGDSATKTIWIINRLQNFSSLTFSVLNQLNELTDALNNILEISIVGVGQDVGNGTLNTSFNATKIYNRKVLNSGLFTLTANNPSVVKIELQLVNYPLTGLSENIDYQLSIVPNAVTATPVTLNPVRAGRIIDHIASTGTSEGYVQDSDGLYVYLTNGVTTIGSPSSGSTIAQSWTDKLYELVWEVFNTPIFDPSGSPTTKGSSASADYSANKRLELPLFEGSVLAGRSSGNPVGSTAGADLITLTVSQLPAHTHTVQSAGGHTHTTNSQGSHTHPVNLTSSGQSNNHTHSLPDTGGGVFAQAVPSGSGTFIVNTSPGTTHTIRYSTAVESANHTHNVFGNTETSGAHTHTTDSQGSHTHTVDSTGSGDDIDIRQKTFYVHKLISTGY